MVEVADEIGEIVNVGLRGVVGGEDDGAVSPAEEIFVTLDIVARMFFGETTVGEGWQVTLKEVKNGELVFDDGSILSEIKKVEVEEILREGLFEGLDVFGDEVEISVFFGVEAVELVGEGGSGGALFVERLVVADEVGGGGGEIIFGAFGFGGFGEGIPELGGEPLGHFGGRKAEGGVATIGMVREFGADDGALMIFPEFAGHRLADERQENLDHIIAGVAEIIGFAVELAVHQVVTEVVFELGGKFADELGAAAESLAEDFAVFEPAADVEDLIVILASGMVVVAALWDDGFVLEKNIAPG